MSWLPSTRGNGSIGKVQYFAACGRLPGRRSRFKLMSRINSLHAYPFREPRSMQFCFEAVIREKNLEKNGRCFIKLVATEREAVSHSCQTP